MKSDGRESAVVTTNKPLDLVRGDRRFGDTTARAFNDVVWEVGSATARSATASGR